MPWSDEEAWRFLRRELPKRVACVGEPPNVMKNIADKSKTYDMLKQRLRVPEYTVVSDRLIFIMQKFTVTRAHCYS